MASVRGLTGAGLVMCSMFTAQLGAVIGVPMMVSHGPLRVSALRLVCAALITLVWIRPNLRSYDRQQWKYAVALGIAMVVMILGYFSAVATIPVGAAISIEFLGPVVVAVYSLRGWLRAALPGLAVIGVVAISFDSHGWLFAPAGVLYALCGAAGWGAYIILMRHIGRLFSEQEGLCLPQLVSAIIAVPVAFLLESGEPVLDQLPMIAGLALLTPLIPLALELMALRRMSVGTFSILMSLEPAIGVLLGVVILQQYLSFQQIVGVLAVMGASAGAVVLSAKESRQTSASEISVI